MNGARNVIFLTRPLGPWGGVKRSFLFQTLCVFSQMKDTKHIRRVFILLPGSCPKGGTWRYLGAKIKFRPAVCPLCYLLLNHWTKFNQIWCVSYSHYWGAQRQIFFAPPPGALGRGQKVKYHSISITKSISKIFIPNFVCVLTYERFKIYQTGFLFCRLGHAPGVGLWGIFFKHGHAANQIDRDDKQNRMQVKFSS